uniref:Small ribosomal subunit protein mS26 n=1 Tax=Timema douglasi TaxID=61478 RepID=A0A7R8VMD4_TIMDO|nr:unnamed protein product [Timema douglasi]
MMLRSSQGFIITCASLGLSESLLPKLVCVQSIRWNRKPRWLPVAKSKMFRVPVRPKIPKEEKDELCRLHNIYRTYFSALRHYLSQEYKKNINQYSGLVDIEGQDSEHEDCMRINAEWNADVAAGREERLVRQAEERKNIILETLIAAEKRQQERAQKADEIVRKEKVS